MSIGFMLYMVLFAGVEASESDFIEISLLGRLIICSDILNS